MNYVRRRRLSLAVELLGCEAMAIIDIASQCGFGSQAAFTRAFGRHYGVTPVSFSRVRPGI
jgi:AraC family transcriptional regulator